jgi:hypothetical protein
MTEEWTPYNNSTPFGLLKEEHPERAALLKEEGPWKFLDFKGNFQLCKDGPVWNNQTVYRRIKAPVHQVVRLHVQVDRRGNCLVNSLSVPIDVNIDEVIELTVDEEGKRVSLGFVNSKAMVQETKQPFTRPLFSGPNPNPLLRLCPHCDGDAAIVSYHSCDCCGKEYNGAVACKNCHARVDHYDSDEEAVAAWNRRVAPPADDEEWRPVSNPPPQDVRVLVYCPNFDTDGGKVIEARLRHEGWGDPTYGEWHCDPTFWRPMPSGPGGHKGKLVKDAATRFEAAAAALMKMGVSEKEAINAVKSIDWGFR